MLKQTFKFTPFKAVGFQMAELVTTHQIIQNPEDMWPDVARSQGFTAIRVLDDVSLTEFVTYERRVDTETVMRIASARHADLLAKEIPSDPTEVYKQTLQEYLRKTAPRRKAVTVLFNEQGDINILATGRAMDDVENFIRDALCDIEKWQTTIQVRNVSGSDMAQDQAVEKGDFEVQKPRLKWAFGEIRERLCDQPTPQVVTWLWDNAAKGEYVPLPGILVGVKVIDGMKVKGDSLNATVSGFLSGEAAELLDEKLGAKPIALWIDVEGWSNDFQVTEDGIKSTRGRCSAPTWNKLEPDEKADYVMAVVALSLQVFEGVYKAAQGRATTP